MASFEKRGDFQWRVKVRRQGQRPISKTFETRALAQAWAREAERKLSRGEIDDLDPSTQRTTVREAIRSYCTHVLPTLARGGKSGQDAQLNRINNEFGDLYVAALRPPAINAWIRELNKQLSPQSVIHHINTFSSLVKHAQTELGVHVPAGNPLRLVTRPAPSRARDRVLLDGEFELMVRAARDLGDGPGMAAGQSLEPMIRMALATSMRQGELLALRWDWIDLRTRVVKLPADNTKNGESRNVALSREAIATLKSMPRHINGRVFGNWKDASSFSKPWQRLLKRARVHYLAECSSSGIEPNPRMLTNLRFHDLRHHATTELFSKGLNPFEVASMTGHKSMAMLKRYTHVDAAKLAKKLG